MYAALLDTLYVNKTSTNMYISLHVTCTNIVYHIHGMMPHVTVAYQEPIYITYIYKEDVTGLFIVETVCVLGHCMFKQCSL